jgi:hypothetical protein
LEPELLEHYEAVVDDWIQQVERLLAESEQDWKDSEDSGPDTELEFWRNRMAKFNSVAEQLKSKDAKMVLGVISSAKSKVLKRWKEVDNGITDALNEAKVTEGGGRSEECRTTSSTCRRLRSTRSRCITATRTQSSRRCQG